MRWTNSEIKTLVQYEQLIDKIAEMPEELIGDEMKGCFLFLEAKLLIQNKSVIGYIDTELDNIYSFNEALNLEEKYMSEGKMFTFHPINFRTMKEYISLLEGKVQL